MKTDALDQYLREINRVALLTVADEQRLAREFRDHQDKRAGHRLVEANLRFVVKVALLKSWSLVKIGTTQAQRKLFFSLARTRREIERLSPGASDPQGSNVDLVAKKLKVRGEDVGGRRHAAAIGRARLFARRSRRLWDLDAPRVNRV